MEQLFEPRYDAIRTKIEYCFKLGNSLEEVISGPIKFPNKEYDIDLWLEIVDTDIQGISITKDIRNDLVNSVYGYLIERNKLQSMDNIEELGR